MEEYDLEPQAANYYRQQLDYATGLKYRLDGEDVIERAVDTLRGGVKSVINGKKLYFDDYKLMNEVGIQRARMVLEAGVNKINHLTKYTDNEMISRQIKALVKAWLFEVTLNAKRWAPEARFTAAGRLVNPDFCKIRNKRLVIQTIENALFQSMLRGTEGFEASLTSKQFSVQEIQDNRSASRGGSRGFFGGLFSRNRGDEGGQYYG